MSLNAADAAASGFTAGVGLAAAAVAFSASLALADGGAAAAALGARSLANDGAGAP